MVVSVTSKLVLLASALTLTPAVWATQTPALPRVVSINLCTDQLLMLLADPGQIMGLGRLSRDAAGSVFHELANDYSQLDPVAEELLPLAPDLVLTGPFTPRHTLSLLNELGLRVETLPIANSVDQMLDNVQRVGDLIQQVERAADIIGHVRQRLAAIAVRVGLLTNPRPRAAVFDTNGYTVGDKSVRGQILELSGWQNVALEKDIEAYGVLGLEELISLRPQALVESPYSDSTYSRGQTLTRHPAIRASGLDPLIIHVPSNQTICAGPWTVDVIEQLLEVRENL
ncbi:MAG: ABC transporter substrate-binding protein [Granulosicoccus sp.]